MQQLPEELLFMVLDDFNHEEIARITRVSKRWRKVALAHPNFWRQVRLIYTIEDKDVRGWIQRLDCGGNQPVEIYIAVAPSDAVPPPVADALVKNMHRAKLLHIRAYTQHLVDFAAALQRPAPVLRSFEFLVSGTDSAKQVPLPPAGLPQDFLALRHPLLEALSLWAMPTAHVRPGQFDHIRKLHLTLSRGVPCIPSSTVAELFPSLQDLFLDSFGRGYLHSMLHDVLSADAPLRLLTIFNTHPSLDLSSFDEKLSKLDYLALHNASPTTVRAAVAHLEGPLELAVDDNIYDQRCPTRWFVTSTHKNQVRAFFEHLETIEVFIDNKSHPYRHPRGAMPLVSDAALYSRLTRLVVSTNVWDLVPARMLFPMVVDIVVVVNSGRELLSIMSCVSCPELRTLAVQGRHRSICVQASDVTRFAKYFIHCQLTRRLKLWIHDGVLEGECSEFDALFQDVEYLGRRFPL